MTTPPSAKATRFLPVDPALETCIRNIGENLLAAMDAHPAPGIFSKRSAYARVMEWSMAIQLDCFVAALLAMTV